MTFYRLHHISQCFTSVLCCNMHSAVYAVAGVWLFGLDKLAISEQLIELSWFLAHRGCHVPRYSQTSLHQTRLIRTSTYIQLGLWSRPQAIIKGRKNVGFIKLRYIEVSAISSMQHLSDISTTFVYIEQCPKLPARSASEMQYLGLSGQKTAMTNPMTGCRQQ